MPDARGSGTGVLVLAHAALRRHLAKNPLPEVDVLAIALVRAVAPLLHQDSFHEAFGIRPGDPMWRDPARRVVIW